MTRKNARKTAARARQATHGGHYAAHYRLLENAGPDTPAIRNLLAVLRASTTFPVAVGRTRPQPSATPEIAVENARRLARNPSFFAETGPIQMAITPSQYHALLAAGAADDVRVQVIRSLKDGHGTTFSQTCKRCFSYISCGENERMGTCACGHEYRIVFDSPNNWMLRKGWSCMECGKGYTPREWVGPVQPWHPVNDGQILCDECFHANPRGAKAEEHRKWFQKAMTDMTTAASDEKSVADTVFRLEAMLIECWGLPETWGWFVEVDYTTGSLKYRVLDVESADPNELLRLLHAKIPAQKQPRPLKEVGTHRAVVERLFTAHQNGRLTDTELDARLSRLGSPGTLFGHVIDSEYETDGPLPVVKGNPLTIQVTREGERYFVECAVPGFSSPLLTVHTTRIGAVFLMEEKLRELLDRLLSPFGELVDNSSNQPTTADFEFDGRYFEVQGDSWRDACENLRRRQGQIASFIERLTT